VDSQLNLGPAVAGTGKPEGGVSASPFFITHSHCMGKRGVTRLTFPPVVTPSVSARWFGQHVKQGCTLLKDFVSCVCVCELVCKEYVQPAALKGRSFEVPVFQDERSPHALLSAVSIAAILKDSSLPAATSCTKFAVRKYTRRGWRDTCTSAD
jgi:hypothetical protein